MLLITVTNVQEFTFQVGQQYLENKNEMKCFIIHGKLLRGNLKEGDRIAFHPQHTGKSNCCGYATFFGNWYGMSIVRHLEQKALQPSEDGKNVIKFAVQMEKSNQTPREGSTIVFFDNVFDENVEFCCNTVAQQCHIETEIRQLFQPSTLT